ncbi:hypothetical protein D3C81_350300 [compost metagenome]
MNTQPVPPLRYILAPTLKEEYLADQAGYDAAMDEPVMTKLSTENDKVDGLEGLYGYVLNSRPRTSVNIDGNESFIDTIKKGVGVVIQAIKDFFKWLWSFFGSKSKKIEMKQQTLKERLSKNGAVDGNIPYPKSTILIYPRSEGKLDNNLNWLEACMTAMVSAATQTEQFASLIKTFCEEVPKMPNEGIGERVVEKNKQLREKVREIFKADGKGAIKFIREKGIEFDIKTGKFTMKPPSGDQQRIKGATFITHTNQLQTLLGHYDKIKKSLMDVYKATHALETSMINSLNAILEKASKEAKDQGDSQMNLAVNKVREQIKTAMFNINALEVGLCRCAEAVLEVLDASIKKG